MHYTTPSPLNAQLWFGELLVAELSNVIAHQGTWFGDYISVATIKQCSSAAEIDKYIVFSKKLHKRLKQGKNPDPREFDRFKDVLYSKLWRVRFSDGCELAMNEGPGFVAGEVSWNHPEDLPSREEAAFKEWCRHT